MNTRPWISRIVASVLLVATVPAAWSAVLINSDRIVAEGDASLEGQDVVVDKATLTLAGPHSFASLQIINGGILTHPAAGTGQAGHALRLTVLGDVLVDQDSRIDAVGMGYGADASPGGAEAVHWAGGGGGHGGHGHRGAQAPANQGGRAFGSLISPDTWGGSGSGGDSGERVPGGGLIHLEVSGILTVAGTIRADGRSAWRNNQGGGAGGSIYLKASTLSGNGTISANGGAGEWVDGGGGGGGRIAIFFSRNDFSGQLSAAGGGGAGLGGAGTIYLKPDTSTGEVRISNPGGGEWTPLVSPVEFDLTIKGNAIVNGDEPLSLRHLLVGTNAILTHLNGSTGLVINASGDVTIESQGAITTDGRGYPIGDNPGPGGGRREVWGGSGAGHGGLGGRSGSAAIGGGHYGSILQPMALGSQGGNGDGGPGTAGGGVIRLIVKNKLTVEGRLTADGAGAPPNNAGGGSGGSIWVTANALAGSGVISANGGAGEWVDGGGGGGGRIALYFAHSEFNGALAAVGGGGHAQGGAGTIYLQREGETAGELRVDNRSVFGNYTPITSPEPFRLILSGRAHVYPERPLLLSRLELAGESVLTHLTGQTNLQVHVQGDVLVAGGSRITADGRGYPFQGNRGVGAGSQVSWGGSGGGHGGLGGSTPTGAKTGTNYGSILQPVDLGSQGGQGDGGPGTAGGGAIRLIVDKNLTVDGFLTADGAGAPPNNAGGGSGGSIYLTVGSLTGTGAISANGGPGEWVDGGGGGGGRIAIYYASNDFKGTLTAFGGGGSQRGGAGTIYTRQEGASFGHLLIHNGEAWGNYTPLSSPEPFELALAGWAVAYPETALTLQDLEVRTNAVLTHLTGQTPCLITVLRKASVAEGGVISADGRGYPVGQDLGPGAGTRLNWGGSGGGHGGDGGRSQSGALGGGNYGSMVEPSQAGSAGGNGDGGPGGAGGGVIRLSVASQLTIDGRISAEGNNAPYNNSGGGAGGSIWISTGTLAGQGLISANGGDGEWVDGGGGGGGRIALHAATQTFRGTVRARGGGGHQRGGSGSIYTRLAGETGGELVLENEGHPGALTALEVPPQTRLVLSGGTTVYPTQPLQLTSLRLKPGAVMTHLQGRGSLSLAVAGDLVIEAGASLNVDGQGYAFGEQPGPGAGQQRTWAGSGGGHGGEGGSSQTGAPGGPAYGSFLEPATFGSAGGSGDTGGGGAGGGMVRLMVEGTLEVAGSISANGLAAPVNNSGGGAGGSIWITAARMSGEGIIRANGGDGEWVDGGGGAGGRIALYLTANQFSGTLTARGRSGHQYGGAGSLYQRLAGESVGRVLIENGDQWGAYTPLQADEAFHLVLANMAQAYPRSTILLSTLTISTNSVLTHLKGQNGLNVVVLGDITLAGAVDVNGRGYPLGGNPGPGAGARRDWAGSGAGHGGPGGASATGMPGGSEYGSSLEPSTFGSQGGFGDAGAGGDGGGLVRLISGGTLTVDGRITANGLAAPMNNSGGGSGGGIFLNVRALAGAGQIRANGGAGEWVDGGGGSGGRIAIYRAASSFQGEISVEGAGGSKPGAKGTLHQASGSSLVWLSPAEGWAHGSLALEAVAFNTEASPAEAQFNLLHQGSVTPLATVTGGMILSADWDSTQMPDGRYELQILVRDARGAVIAQSTRQLSINNSVTWHRGMISADETWKAGKVHVIDGEIIVTDKTTLTFEPGVIIKFLPGSRLTLLSGATVHAPGSSASPVSLTSFLDDSLGGDSNLDGASSRPVPGTWRLALKAGSVFDANEYTRLRYHSQSFGGTLAASEAWTADSLHEITETVVVPGGVTLTLEAGAMVKFAPGQGIEVRSGGTLRARGSLAQPVVFTSLRDDARGGDSNQDGARTTPAAGDWRSLRFDDGSTGEIDYAEIRYGGNSMVNAWGAGGVLESGGGTVTVRNSIIADALKDGAFCWGQSRFENCLVLRCDRGLTAVGEMMVLNSTLVGNRIGLLEHVGALTVRNSIVSHSIDVGISHDLGGHSPVVTSCNVWNPQARQGNYSGTTDRTGQDGNISAEPRYKDPEADNYRLHFASPGIDAADGSLAPVLDFAGLPRFDDPRTGNSGLPAANGAVPDMGAFEFVENAPSLIDLVVENVSGPGQLVAGSLAHLEWTIVNRGAETVSGPWHDAIYLRAAGSGQRLWIGEVLSGRALTLGPGQSFRMTADVRVPGGVGGSYHWLVAANSRGDLFESANAANNETAAAAGSVLALPEIPLDGSPLASAFVLQEEQQWFQCAAPAGQDVRFDLNLAGAAGVAELYIGRGFVPTKDNFDARQREWNSPVVSAVISGSSGAAVSDGTNLFYVLAVGRVLAEVPASFALRATTAPFTVEAVAPAKVGNAGLATLAIQGSGFGSDTAFVVRQGAEQRLALRQSVRESGLAFATFDLTGLPPGRVEVLAQMEGLSVALASAVEVVAGGTGDFYASLSGPGNSRAGRLSTWFVTYGNRGLVDVALPLLRFSAPGAVEIQLFESTLNWADAVDFWAINPEVLLPTLGPGQEVTLEIKLKALAPLTVQLQMITGEELAASAEPFDWSSLPRPEGADPVKWTALVNSLAPRLGSTVGEYLTLLQQDLAGLAASPLRHSYLANVNGRWLLGEEPDGVPSENEIIEVPSSAIERLAGPQAAPAKIPGDGIRKTYWIVLTNEEYTGIGASALPGTRKDFNDLSDYMRKELRVPEEQIFSAHDGPGDANTFGRNNILAVLKHFKGKVDADDNLVVVFSGHGGRIEGGAGYLCFNSGYMSPVAFTQAIDEVGAGTTYFMNDSCHSEAFNELVKPSNTTFVGFAGTMANRISHDTASGGELIKSMKWQLRRCRSLGRSFELTELVVSKKYESKPLEKKRQHPVLTNPSHASLDGKPWNDPSGFEQELRRAFQRLRFHPIAQQVLQIVGSVDPNDKYALSGVGPEKWVQPDQALLYEVLFENKPTAAAPAQEVLVTDDLDAQLDWSTFELKSISFNDARLTVPPGLQRFSSTARVGTDTNEVTVEVSFNPATGRISWLMRSRDALTGDLPEDPFAGFLPPNDASHRGEGSLSYTIRPKLGLDDGVKLRNQAVIIFDPTYGANPPILTPVVTNTIDGRAPVSAIQALPAEIQSPFRLQWDGADAAGGSGLASYDIYVSENDSPYRLWLAATTETQAEFTGRSGATYRFYSVARDAAGLTEAAPAAPDTVTTVTGGLTFAHWAATQALPANASDPSDDPDADGLNNFMEYALALNPKVPDSRLATPKAGLVKIAGQNYLTLTFRQPITGLSDAQRRLTWSPRATPWMGSVSAFLVGEPVTRDGYVEITVRCAEPVTARPQGFLRLDLMR